MIGQTLLHYRITDRLGAGGMGEVYLARDEKLNRDVALKVLPEGALANEEARRRFRKEADALSRLSHPHIATLLDFGTAAGTDFLVMELVRGPSLRDEIEGKGALLEKTVIRLGVQLARGLQAAHDQGIVHQDLKPSNLQLTDDGLLKILDFGLARLLPKDGGPGEEAAATQTAVGQAAGTLPYMSPEQVRGLEVDTRTDLYAAGAVLYELATGRRPFSKTNAADLASAILHQEPPQPREVNDRVSPGLEAVILKALDKDPELRCQTAKDLRVDLERLQQRSSTTSVSTGIQDSGAPGGFLKENRGRGRERLAWAVLALALGGLGAWHASSLTPPREPPELVRFGVEVPAVMAHDNVDLTVSPDGRHVAFAPWSGEGSVWLRSLDTRGTRRLPGTEGGSAPFWSHDGKALAFFGYGGRGELVLRRITLATGDVRTICAIPGGFWGGGAWSQDDQILFGGGDQDERFRIYTVSAEGGEGAVLFDLDTANGERGHYWPQFLPGGRRFIFDIESDDPEVTGIWRSSLDRPDQRQIVLPAAFGEYAPSGHLLYVLSDRPDELIARPFDAASAQLTADPITLASLPAARGTWSVGGDVLAYIDREPAAFELAWFDREGVRLGTVGGAASYGELQPSPDGSRAAVSFATQGNWDVWTLDLDRGLSTRVTSHPSPDLNPVWSRDGRELLFSSERVGDGVWRIYRKRRDGSGRATVLKGTSRNAFPKAVTPDGKALLFVAGGPPSNDSVWALPLDGGGTPELVLKVEHALDDPQISPDGRWLAYCANETGEREVYLVPYGREGEKSRVSPAGGRQPRWRDDGRELFYVTPQGRLMAVAVREAEAGIELGVPAGLFNAGVRSRTRSQYGVTTDGQRFLVITPVAESGRSLNVILNWPSLLERPR